MSIAAPNNETLTGPKQTKLLGATVRGLGTITAVSQRLAHGFALVEGADRVNRLVRFSDLKHDEVVFPAELQPYTAQTERVAYGTWDEVYSLVPAAPVVWQVAA